MPDPASITLSNGAVVGVGDVVHFAHEVGGPRHTVTAIDQSDGPFRGMVDLHDMSGQFAPHVFVRASPLTFGDGIEAAAKIARRGSDVKRGWISPGVHDPQTNGELYSALREGQEIEKAIRALAQPAQAQAGVAELVAAYRTIETSTLSHDMRVSRLLHAIKQYVGAAALAALGGEDG